MHHVNQSVHFQQYFQRLKVLFFESQTIPSAIFDKDIKSIHKNQKKAGRKTQIIARNINTQQQSRPSLNGDTFQVTLNISQSEQQQPITRFTTKPNNTYDSNKSLLKRKDISKSVVNDKNKNSILARQSRKNQQQRSTYHESNSVHKLSIPRNSMIQKTPRRSFDTSYKTSRLNTLNFQKTHKQQKFDKKSINHPQTHQVDSIMKSVYLQQFKCKIQDQLKNLNSVLRNISKGSATSRSSSRTIQVNLSKSSLTPSRFKISAVKPKIKEYQQQYQKMSVQSKSIQKSYDDIIKKNDKSINKNDKSINKKDPKTIISNVTFANLKQKPLLTTRIAKYQ